MMTVEERANEIRNMMAASDNNVVKLYTDWCNLVGNGNTPPTPISAWHEFIENNDVDIKKMYCFCEWHSYFYIIDGHLITTDELRADAEYSSYFDDCVTYYSDTLERYNRAMAILNNEPYIVNEVSPDFYI